MFNIVKKELDWGGRKLVLETGEIARQALGSVIVTYGETKVMCNVTAAKSVKADIDFFPLTVHYQERFYAAGKIPGGFFKREARPSEKETLTSRLIDRPIRPLFDKRYKNETQVVATVLEYDGVNDPDIIALIAASAALSISGLPFLATLGASRVGYKDGELVLNPPVDEIEEHKLDLVLSGTSEGVLMVESEAHELDESEMLNAVDFGSSEYKKVIKLIDDFAKEVGFDEFVFPEKENWEENLIAIVETNAKEDLKKAFEIVKKQDRSEAILNAREKINEDILEELGADIPAVKISEAFKNLESSIVRDKILNKSKRIDGRKLNEIRPIEVRTGLLKRTHGSALFTRGETQALVVSTLGTSHDEQIMESLTGEYKENFLLHYNFPPYSVGEAGRMGPPGRREIGHGKLAWRAIHPLFPSKEKFPYTSRVVSEITESNGSSSMASVCGASMSLMDAGVPLKSPCAGIAMGLIKDGENFAVLSDIMGDEDHLGDMDFKVAGTKKGITTMQMDIKITSITKDIMKKALEQAKEGRIHILKEMEKAITEAKSSISEHAPKIVTIKIAKSKIREVIGAGGKVIREITEVTGAKISIDDEGEVNIASSEQKSIDEAIKWVESIVEEPEIGKIYKGKVIKCVDFGAFVNFMKGKDGLLHISELADYRVKKVTDIIKENEEIYVKCIGIDKGKVKLTYKDINQKTGKEEK